MADDLEKVMFIDIVDIERVGGVHKDNVSTVVFLGIPSGGDRGVNGNGINAVTNTNTFDYITISTTGNAIDFGDSNRQTRNNGAHSNGGNNRGLFGGGELQNNITKININSLGNGTDAGDITLKRYGLSGTSNHTNDRGIWSSGQDGGINGIWASNIIDYNTISSGGNSVDFGDFVMNRQFHRGVASNGINDRAVFTDGWFNKNEIEYITISSLGNAMDFGDIISTQVNSNRNRLLAVCNLTGDRAVFVGGYQSVVMDYITISSTGNSTNFGNCIMPNPFQGAGTSNGTNNRGVFTGGSVVAINDIDYITISTPGNSLDFGEVPDARTGNAMCSNA